MLDSNGPRGLRDLAILLLASGLAFFAFLGRAPVHRTQEVRVLETAREMGERGDLVVPHFCARPRLEKPPLAYWLALAGYRLTGEVDEWSGRLYSSIAGALTVLLVYAFGRSLGSPRLGLFAGLVLSTSTLFFRAARRAETDALLACAVTAAFYAFWRAFESREGSRPSARMWAVLGWGAAGLAFLSKGPPGLFYPISLALYLALLRRWRGFRLLFEPLGLALFLVLALPWYLEMLRRQDLALGVFLKEIWTAVEGADHGKSFLYAVFFYLIAVWADFAPWAPLLLLAVPAAWRKLRTEPGVALFLAWMGGIYLQLELVGNKQAHYAVPALPALALLVAFWLDREAPRLGFLREPRAAWAAGALAAVMLVATPLWFWLMPPARTCRDFARAIAPLIEGAQVYFYGTEVPELDFYLRKVIPLLGSQAIERDGRVYLIARERDKDDARRLDESLGRDPRFRLALTSGPRELPLRLYEGTRGSAH